MREDFLELRLVCNLRFVASRHKKNIGQPRFSTRKGNEVNKNKVRREECMRRRETKAAVYLESPKSLHGRSAEQRGKKPLLGKQRKLMNFSFKIQIM